MIRWSGFRFDHFILLCHYYICSSVIFYMQQRHIFMFGGESEIRKIILHAFRIFRHFWIPPEQQPHRIIGAWFWNSVRFFSRRGTLKISKQKSYKLKISKTYALFPFFLFLNRKFKKYPRCLFSAHRRRTLVKPALTTHLGSGVPQNFTLYVNLSSRASRGETMDFRLYGSHKNGKKLYFPSTIVLYATCSWKMKSTPDLDVFVCFLFSMIPDFAFE